MMINNIIESLGKVSLTQKNGKFLADKSYGFDTVCFISKFILHNAQNNCFFKSQLRENSIKYIEDIFQLTQGTAGAVNYYLETINLLEFSGVLLTHDNNKYFIRHREILEYICRCPENAYIFVYLLTYYTYKNDGLLDDYKKLCNSKDLDEKKAIVNKLYESFCSKSVSIEASGSNWSKQLVKYSLIVLGYANKQDYITRTLSFKDRLVGIEDISLNVAGTRTPIYLPKKNDYLHNFNYNYVRKTLKDYLFISVSILVGVNDVVDSIATGLADLKLAIQDTKGMSKDVSDYDKDQYIETIVKTRNQSIQRQFRKSLLDNNEHVCPICGFSFENFLIASHIKPYSHCDDTYDAINHYNGLLLCPNHDKLFEDARYMTIDYKTGEIHLSEAAKNSSDFGMLEGKAISKVYIQNERRHYLEWHNNRFLSQK